MALRFVSLVRIVDGSASYASRPGQQAANQLIFAMVQQRRGRIMESQRLLGQSVLLIMISRKQVVFSTANVIRSEALQWSTGRRSEAHHCFRIPGLELSTSHETLVRIIAQWRLSHELMEPRVLVRRRAKVDTVLQFKLTTHTQPQPNILLNQILLRRQVRARSVYSR